MLYLPPVHLAVQHSLAVITIFVLDLIILVKVLLEMSDLRIFDLAISGPPDLGGACPLSAEELDRLSLIS